MALLRTGPLVAFWLAASVLPSAAAAPGGGNPPKPVLKRAEESYAQAEKSYALGRFDEARTLYERAFDLTPLPGLLFNMGQCERNLGHWERAAFFYERYLAVEPKAKNRPAVLALIAQMKEKVREAEARHAAAAAPLATGASGAAPPTGTAGGTVVSLQIPASGAAPPALPSWDPEATRPTPPSLPLTPVGPPATARATPLYRRWWLWTAIGVVVAGAAAAAVSVAALNPSQSSARLSGTLGPPIDASH